MRLPVQASEPMHAEWHEPSPPAAMSRSRRMVLWALVCAAMVGAGVILYLVQRREAEGIRQVVRQAAIEEGVDPLLAEAVVHAESGGNPRAKSRANAYGLMQLLVPTAEQLAGRQIRPDELYEPRFNARLGCRYLARLWNRYDGDLRLVLMAYNAGPTRVKRWLARDPDARRALENHAFKETRAYVFKVLKYMRDARQRG